MVREKHKGKSSHKADIVDSIGKLEDLIAETERPLKLEPEIPVLTDIVDPAKVRKYAKTKTNIQSVSTETGPLEDFPTKKLSELANLVDQKMSNELDSLVKGLKRTIKNSIIDEIKEQLKKESALTKPSSSNIKPVKKPSK